MISCKGAVLQSLVPFLFLVSCLFQNFHGKKFPAIQNYGLLYCRIQIAFQPGHGLMLLVKAHIVMLEAMRSNSCLHKTMLVQD